MSNQVADLADPASVRQDVPTLDPLLDRCAAGDDRAWRELHRVYHPVALRFLRRMGVAGPDLDDVAQDVFTQVHRYLGRFERRADFKTWLYRICMSQASRLRQRCRVAEALRRVWGALSFAAATPVEPAWGEETIAAQVERALGTLSQRHREVFVLRELEGLSGEAIAGTLGIPHATVRRRLHDARRQFEQAMRQPTRSAR
jgi:RNA polymerase sigma-70 factor (ECF subfamily)